MPSNTAPARAGIEYGWAEILRRQGAYEEAERIYNELPDAVRNIKVTVQRGMIHLGWGNVPQAYTWLAQAREQAKHRRAPRWDGPESRSLREGEGLQLLPRRLRRGRSRGADAVGPPREARLRRPVQWVCPGRDVTGGAQDGGFLLELPGLVVQILNPPTHFLPGIAPAQIEVRANVTMMCGCPIGVEPWEPSLFDVSASVKSGDTYAVEFPLVFDAAAPYDALSQFAAPWTVPANTSGQAQIYEITVMAFQQSTGNTGVDTATLIIPVPPPPPAPKG